MFKFYFKTKWIDYTTVYSIEVSFKFLDENIHYVLLTLAVCDFSQAGAFVGFPGTIPSTSVSTWAPETPWISPEPNWTLLSDAPRSRSVVVIALTLDLRWVQDSSVPWRREPLPGIRTETSVYRLFEVSWQRPPSPSRPAPILYFVYWQYKPNRNLRKKCKTFIFSYKLTN